MAELIIPPGTTSIEDGAYKGRKDITSVVIPDSVTEIGKNAFFGCTGLTSITIPNSVTKIGDSAFSYCSGLTSIMVEDGNTKYDSRGNCNAIIETATNKLLVGCQNSLISDSVTEIGDSAFYGCDALTSLNIPDSVTKIGYNAFFGCDALTSLNIPDSVTEIGFCAFWNCTCLTRVNIPNSVTEISNDAFVCSGLTCVNIPNSVTKIGSNAFWRCTGLTSVNIPTSVSTIGNSAFCRCTGLTSVTSFDMVTKSGYGAFWGRTSLTSSSSTNSVGLMALPGWFNGCSGLTSVNIPTSVTEIGESAFSGCSGLTNVSIPYSVTEIGDYAFYGCTGLTRMTIPNSVTKIGFNAFIGCSGLTIVTIGNSVTEIDFGAFRECDYLKEIHVPKGSKEYYVSLFRDINAEKLCDKIIEDDIIDQLTPRLEDYHFFDRLLPFAIENEKISNEDLLVLWIFCQHFGHDKGRLERVFFGSDFRTFYTEMSEDEKENNLAYQIYVNHREPSPDEVLALVILAIQFMKSRGQFELKALAVRMFGGTREDEPQVERDLVVNLISRLIERFISPLKIVDCKHQWNLANKKGAFEEMSFYFFLDRFLKRYEPIIRNNVPANWQCDWPKLTKLAETLSPTTAEEAIAGLELIYDLCASPRLNLGLDTDSYTIKDVIGCLQMPNEREKVCQLIRNNPA